MAIPSRIVGLAGEMATVECFGEQRNVSLMLLDIPLAIGDYVLVQAGGFAFQKIDATDAVNALDLFGDLMSQTPDRQDYIV
jgi:hydrogenase expression/formation protein HypC